jgi:hypothetical protein
MKLFHCIVVMGAAIGSGCGSKEEADPPGGSDGSSDGPAILTASEGGCQGDGSEGFLYVVGCASNDPCGAPQAPRRPQDCPLPQELECNPVTSSCQCDLAAPLSATDCPLTAQFRCDDWLQPCGCKCVVDAALDPSACGCDTGAATDAASGCPGGTWACHSYDPPVGCECRIVVAIL